MEREERLGGGVFIGFFDFDFDFRHYIVVRELLVTFQFVSKHTSLEVV